MQGKRAEDLTPLEDPIDSIRRNHKLYVGDQATGQQLASRIIGDITWLNALPARIERIGSFWIIASEKDWLASEDGRVSMKPFFSIVPFPIAGQNCHHGEVLVTAFAQTAVTWGSDGRTWIVGDDGQWPLMVAAGVGRLEPGRGRILAFAMEGS